MSNEKLILSTLKSMDQKMQTELASLHAEMQSIDQKMGTELASLRTEMQTRDQRMNAHFASQDARMLGFESANRFSRRTAAFTRNWSPFKRIGPGLNSISHPDPVFISESEDFLPED